MSVGFWDENPDEEAASATNYNYDEGGEGEQRQQLEQKQLGTDGSDGNSSKEVATHKEEFWDDKPVGKVDGRKDKQKDDEGA